MSRMKLLKERIQEAVETAIDNKRTIQEIADACGVSVQSVYAWKRGETINLKGETLVELAEVSGLNARWIINQKGPKVTLTTDQKTILAGFALFGSELRENWLLAASQAIERDSASKNDAA